MLTLFCSVPKSDDVLIIPNIKMENLRQLQILGWWQMLSQKITSQITMIFYRILIWCFLKIFLLIFFLHLVAFITSGDFFFYFSKNIAKKNKREMVIWSLTFNCHSRRIQNWIPTLAIKHLAQTSLQLRQPRQFFSFSHRLGVGKKESWGAGNRKGTHSAALVSWSWSWSLLTVAWPACTPRVHPT